MKKGIICLIAGIVIGIALAVGAMFIVRNINGGKADEGTMTRGTGDAVEYTDAGAARETRPVWNESNQAAQQSSLQNGQTPADAEVYAAWRTQNAGDRHTTAPGNKAETQDTSVNAAEQSTQQILKQQQNVTRSASGRLHVSGTVLSDESGNTVQLRGVSTHGLAWFPEYVNKEAFRTLRDDWNANVVRLALYTEEYGGYCSGGDRAKLKQTVADGVEYATELGMYVIIDWHILSDNNPNNHKSDAIEFFSEMSARYAGYTNVIYEICNEPHYVNWNNDIKPYAQDVISAIRANDKNAVIIVGTNTWSQDVDDVIGNRIDDDNVMYALHFYAATHKDYIRDKLKKAIDNGIPVFVSESSICDASGNGGIDYDSGNTWLRLMNDNNVSFVAWSLCNKNETSALIRPECSKKSGWTTDELSDAGRWYREAVRGER
ncbi:MAG: glycoside hydrolase family 5 protein [Clostridia bacterium]|nr:glycoside hydrolase family 5 protein [Clostridia bacterium]